MKKKIVVILLMCSFIVSVIPVSSSAKVNDSIAGVYRVSDLQGASSNGEFFGLFELDGNFYNILNCSSSYCTFYQDGKSVSVRVTYTSIPTNHQRFTIYYLSTNANSGYGSYDNTFATYLSTKKLSSITTETPSISTAYNFVGKWVLKNTLSYDGIPTRLYGFVNFYSVGSSTTFYGSNLSIRYTTGNTYLNLLTYYKNSIEWYEFYGSSGWNSSYSYIKTINITDSYFITDEAAEVFYNWLCNNAVSYNDGPVPDSTVPPDTQPPDTQPPDTQPPDTQPPDTDTPDTEMPDTDIPVIPPADRFGFQAMMFGLSYSLFGENGLAVQIWSWLVSPTVLPFFGIGIALALLLLAILIVKRTF